MRGQSRRAASPLTGTSDVSGRSGSRCCTSVAPPEQVNLRESKTLADRAGGVDPRVDREFRTPLRSGREVSRPPLREDQNLSGLAGATSRSSPPEPVPSHDTRPKARERPNASPGFPPSPAPSPRTPVVALALSSPSCPRPPPRRRHPRRAGARRRAAASRRWPAALSCAGEGAGRVRVARRRVHVEKS